MASPVSETMTVMKLLCLSLRLTFATTQPSAHESVSTKIEMSAVSSTPPRSAIGAAETVTQ